MKLQRFQSRKTNGKTYYKWVLNPRSEDIAALGWQHGDDLTATVKDGALLIQRAQRHD